MEGFLKPVVEAAGYRCVSRLAPGEAAAVALTLDDAPIVGGGAPVLRLRRDRDASHAVDASIYRYDRAALRSALAAAGRGR